MPIYKDCDVRGVYGRELTAAEVYPIGQAEVYRICRGLAAMASGKSLSSSDMRAWHFGSLERAADAMIRYGVSVEPDPVLVPRYEEIYGKFRADVRKIYGVEV